MDGTMNLRGAGREPRSTTRRSMLAGVAGALLLGANQRRRPNVVLLIADDMNGYGFLDSYPGVKMPHLRNFKKSAITFERAYCASPACVPSRAAMFSGLYPHTTGAYRNGSDPWTKLPLKDTESMPETFKRSGYETFGRGKLFHAPLDKARETAMWDNEYWGGGFGPFPPERDQVLGQFWGCTPWEGPDSDFPDVKNAGAAVGFLRQPHDRPFFLAFGVWRPHTPFTAPKRFFEMYRREEIRLPVPGYKGSDLADVPEEGRKLAAVWGERFESAGIRTEDRWREFVHAYFATTSFADWSVGRVIEALDHSPHADNTLVVFVSDNGYHCGEKDHWEKTTLWEASALTPMAVRMPGRKQAGTRCKRPVNQVDLYPTLIDLCGLRPPAQRPEGQSLRPLLDNPEAVWRRPSLTTYGERFASVRDERYRYIRYPDGAEELYDHASDPYEWENLAKRKDLSSVRERLGKHVPLKWAPTLGGRLG